MYFKDKTDITDPVLEFLGQKKEAVNYLQLKDDIIPRKASKKTRRISLLLTQETHDILRFCAAKHEYTMNGLIGMILEKFIEKMK